jgi:hypothetical protein
VHFGDNPASSHSGVPNITAQIISLIVSLGRENLITGKFKSFCLVGICNIFELNGFRCLGASFRYHPTFSGGATCQSFRRPRLPLLPERIMHLSGEENCTIFPGVSLNSDVRPTLSSLLGHW